MSKLTIQEQLDSFKKHLWSNEQPMEFAAAVVEELLLEVQRQQTVMRASKEELSRHWQTHVGSEDINAQQLTNLVESLSSKRKGFYAQYLGEAEYREFIARQTNFETFAKIMQVEGAEQSGEED